MHLIKPSWILHRDETRQTKPWMTLYALDVHPDGTRIATGGLDTIVRVWNVAPVVSKEREDQGEEQCPRLLSTLTSHTGAVMSLKWSNAGVFLASGADDGAVLVWTLDGSKGGKVWGSDTANIENWKATRRSVGHQSDVANVAWSPDDSHLASVGLDNQVLIWSGTNFELVRKLSGHLGFVKGVVFDPVGQYLATQSDDNTLKIWRTADWGLEKSIDSAFEDAPKSNITRPAWSPDGAHIVTPNSMNGPVFVAGVIRRKDVKTGEGWDLASSLIGHPDIVQVTSYNPLLFLRDSNQPPTLPNITTLVAISARSSISLWFSDMSHPFVVLEEVFDRDVLDMSWSKDGTQLWSCSSDGQVSVASFTLDEFPSIAPSNARLGILSAHGVVPRLLAPTSRPLSAINGLGTGTSAQPNKLVARKGPNAKRPRVAVQPLPLPIQQPQPVVVANPVFANAPVFDAPTNGNAFASTSTSTAAAHQYPQILPQQQQQQLYPPSYPPPSNGAATSPSRKRKASTQQPVQDDPNSYRLLPPWAIPPTGQLAGYGADRLSPFDYRLNGHTLAGIEGEEKEMVVLAPSYCLRDRQVGFEVTNRLPEGEVPKKGMERVLGVGEVRSLGRLSIEDSEMKDTLEFRNFDEGERKGQAEVRVTTTKKTLWTDYLPNWVVASAGSPTFTAVGCEDASLITWSPAGRRLMPTLILDSPLSFLVAEGPFLLALTALGSLTVWNLSPSIPRPRSIFPPLNISSLLASSASTRHPNPSITSSSLLPNGTPLIALSSGSTFSYDRDLSSWTRVCEPWWSKSDAWEGRRGRNANASSAIARGIIRGIEGAVNDIVVDEQSKGGPGEEDAEMSGGSSSTIQGEVEIPQGSGKDFSIALTLSHLETRLRAAVALDSPSEYKTSLLTYTRELAKEGLRSKAEELIKELLGPIYNKPGKNVEEEWAPTILGLSKRDLLRDVLRELGKDRVTKVLADEYQKILKDISSA